MFPIEVRELTQTINGQRILNRIALFISAGEIVGMLGANGAGKTTLLRCLAGCLRPTSGQVLWFGVSPARRPASRRLVGYAAHESFVYPELSARENLMFAARMHGLANPEERVAQRLAACGLQTRADLAAGRLSKGWRQRLSIVRALIHDPPIAIVDEPFAGLDTDGCRWLEHTLLELRARGCAVCLTGHDEGRIASIGDRCFKLSDGILKMWSECTNGLLRSA